MYGGNSKKQKRNFQVGNKILLDWKSKNQNRTGYFTVELINPISPFFFDDNHPFEVKMTLTFTETIIMTKEMVKEGY